MKKQNKNRKKVLFFRNKGKPLSTTPMSKLKKTHTQSSRAPPQKKKRTSQMLTSNNVVYKNINNTYRSI